MALDHLLAEMGALCQFFFDVLVDLDFTLKRFNLVQQFIVLCDYDFCLLALKFQLIRQLIILEHCQTGSLGELFIIQRK